MRDQVAALARWRRACIMTEHRSFHGGPMRTPLLSVALLGAALIASGPSAFAFTIVNQDSENGGGSAKFADPDQKTENFANSSQGGAGTSTLHIGNSTLRFGASPSYQPSPWIQDRFIDNPAARTVPSASWPGNR